jgi:DNA-binding transcriptional LysR family regulator
MDRLDAMRAFVQVVDSGSYTKAALQLNLHKATVSQQIQQLEDRLGTRLLTRTTRSVATAVFSKPGMSLERPEIGDAKRVDPL